MQHHMQAPHMFRFGLLGLLAQHDTFSPRLFKKIYLNKNYPLKTVNFRTVAWRDLQKFMDLPLWLVKRWINLIRIASKLMMWIHAQFSSYNFSAKIVYREYGIAIFRLNSYFLAATACDRESVGGKFWRKINQIH